MSRMDAIDRLFATFDFNHDGIIEEGVLEKAYDVLLTPALRRLVGDNPENIYEHCDTNKDRRFERDEIIVNKCHCIENCSWATRVNSVCQMADKHPGWYDA